MNGVNILKKYKLLILCIFLSIVLVGCSQSSDDGNQNNNISEQNEEAEIAELAEIWANALKTRDGKPRYEMMSEKAKEKFKQEQINRSGENWNYNIGWSSPSVVSFEIEVEGMTANIVYAMKTSEPANYTMSEILTFVRENGKLVVDDYETIDDLDSGHISIEERKRIDLYIKVMESAFHEENGGDGFIAIKLDTLEGLSNEGKEEILKHIDLSAEVYDFEEVKDDATKFEFMETGQHNSTIDGTVLFIEAEDFKGDKATITGVSWFGSLGAVFPEYEATFIDGEWQLELVSMAVS
jgi:PBP1b-binding outer membrane lipoprotein LpoB